MKKPSAAQAANIKKADAFVAACNAAQQRGMVPLYNPVLTFANDNDRLVKDIFQSSCCGGSSGQALPGVGPISAAGSEVFAQAGGEIKIKCGGLGAMPWGGQRNRMPLDIINSCKSQPYSSSPVRYLVEMACGFGPKFVYEYAVLNGDRVEVRECPFEHAGLILQNMLDNAKQQQQQNLLSLDDINPIRQQLDEWKRTNAELQAFLQNNDINEIFAACMEDSIYTDMFMLRFGLDRNISTRTEGTTDVHEWKPKIATIDTIPIVCGRLEKRNEFCNIEHIYYSESWRNTLRTFTDSCAKEENAVMYPLIGKQRTDRYGSRSSVSQLNEYVSAVNSANKGGKSAKLDLTNAINENSWFASCYKYLSNDRAYYAQPHWWSIYLSLLFMYASTFIYDKSVQRKNSTMFRYVIYIDLGYFDQIRAQMGIEEGDTKRIMEFRNSLISNIENFTANRQNNGKMLILDKWFNGHDIMKSVEIVKIPEAEGKVADMNELASIHNIISWAFGVHSALLGDHPGAGKSTSGGTFQRELHLLKQNQMAPRQQQFISFIHFIRDFNNWTSHLKCKIDMPILTTLDAQKTGVTSTSQEAQK